MRKKRSDFEKKNETKKKKEREREEQRMRECHWRREQREKRKEEAEKAASLFRGRSPLSEAATEAGRERERVAPSFFSLFSFLPLSFLRGKRERNLSAVDVWLRFSDRLLRKKGVNLFDLSQVSVNITFLIKSCLSLFMLEKKYFFFFLLRHFSLVLLLRSKWFKKLGRKK